MTVLLGETRTLMACRFPATCFALLSGLIFQSFIPTFGQSTNGPNLSIVVAAGQQGLRISWPSSASDFVLEETGTVQSNWQSSVLGPALSGNEFVVNLTPSQNARFFRIRKVSDLAGFRILSYTPVMDATEVGVTYRPQIFFSRKARPGTLSTNSIYATVGGKVIPANVVPASDGSFAWLFFKRALPGAARVRVTVDGSIIAGEGELALLDADGDGRPSGVLEYEFTTVSLAELTGTSLVGIVVEPGPDMIPRTADDLQAGQDGRFGTMDDVFTYPLSGVRVFLRGRETNVVTTGADGRFRFDAVPVGNVKIVVDGTTTATRPTGVYFPEMVLDAAMVLGKENWSMTNGHEVYLPRLSTNILQSVTAITNNTLVKATPEGALGLSAFQRNLLTVDIAPNSLVSPDGQILTNGGQVGISTVPADVVRDMLPPGILQHTFDITVQAPGVATLSTPAPMTFPNVFNQPPGTKLNFLSFDHTTGRLVIEGTATVSDDGTYVRTDPGTGITHPGWHGLTPPGGPNDPPCPPGFKHDIIVTPVPVMNGAHDYLLTTDEETFTLSFGNAAAKVELDQTSDPCSPLNLGATPLTIEIEVENAAKEFLDGFSSQVMELLPGQQKAIKVGMKKLVAGDGSGRNGIRYIEEDRLYGARILIRGFAFEPKTPLFLQDIYVYRFVDAADSNHEDSVIDFPRTAVDTLRVRSFQNLTTPAAKPLLSYDAANVRNFPANDSQFSRFLFKPSVVGNNLTSRLSLHTPTDRFVGTLLLRGDCVRQKWYVDRESFLNVIKDVVESVNHISPEIKALFDTHAERESVLNATISRVEELYKVYLPGLQRIDSPENNSVTIKAETVFAADGQVYGEAEHVDNDVWQLLVSRIQYSRSEASFRLSRLINQIPGGTIKMYPEDQLYGLVSLSTSELINQIGKTFAHELGHELGLVHTFKSQEKRLNIIGDDYDIMGYGLDREGTDSFLVTADALRIALGTFWEATAVENVFEYYLKWELGNRFHKRLRQNWDSSGAKRDAPIGGEDPNVPPAPIIDQAVPWLVEAGTYRWIGNTVDVGNVKADGPGGEVAQVKLGLRNVGDQSLIVSEVLVDSDSGFSATPLEAGIAVPAKQEIPFTITFDPKASGPSRARLRLRTNATLSEHDIMMVGVGVSPVSDISILIPNNNVGGVDIGSTGILAGIIITNSGSLPLTITRIRSAEVAFRTHKLPPGLLNGPTVIPVNGFASFDVEFLPDSIGLKQGRIEVLSNDPDSPTSILRLVGTGTLPNASSLSYGDDYVAVESPDFPNTPVLRARSDANGTFEFFLPPEQRYHVVIFDPVSGLIAHMYGITAPSGQNTQFGTPVFLPSTAPDSDGDGLPDDVEFAIGSDPNDADTDGNGLKDLAEVAQGRNPLGDQVAATGIIGRLAMNQARSVTLHSPTQADPNVLHAYVGDSTTMHIVDLTRPVTPSIISSLQAFGTVTDVAVDTVTQTAIIGAGRLSLVNIQNPAAPVVYHTIAFEGAEVEAANGYAYTAKFAGHDLFATLRSIDLVSTSAVHALTLPVREVDAMVLDADMLYLLGNRTLVVIQVDGTNMTLRGSLPIPGGKGRFSIVNGIAYFPFEGDTSTGVTGGYTTVDLSNPDLPRIIQTSQAPAGAATPGSMIAANGSGLGLLAGQAGVENPWAVDLMNISDPANTYAFLTRLNVPRGGIPMALQVGGGLGVLANWTDGLVVLNYLAADIAGIPPEVGTLRIQPDGSTNIAGVQLIEGRPFYMSAALRDDVQVRSVELLVDGIVAQRSISAPFDLSAIAPNLADKSSIVVQIRAVDTGGNAGLSAAVELPIVFDPVAPSLLQIDPAEGELKGRGFRQARLVFSKPMGRSATNVQNYDLRTAAGQSLKIHSATLREGDRSVLVSFDRLEPGEYIFSLQQSQITDRAGNILASSALNRAFKVDDYSIRWANTEADTIWVNTSWFTPTNWIPQRVPNAEDSILIDVPGTNAQVTIAPPVEWQRLGLKLPVKFRRLDSKEDLTAAFVQMEAEEYIYVDGIFRPFVALITNTVVKGGTNAVIFGSNFKVDNVTMEGEFLLSGDVDVQRRLTLNGTIGSKAKLDFGQAGGSLRFPYSGTVDGQGTIKDLSSVVIGAPSGLNASDPPSIEQEIMIRPGITFLNLDAFILDGLRNRLFNYGSIIYDSPYVQFAPWPFLGFDSRFTTNEFINLGLIEVKNSALLNLVGNPMSRLINEGTIRASDGGYLINNGVHLVSTNLICEPTATFQLGRHLTAVGGVSELSGGGLWLATANSHFISGSSIPIRLFGTNSPVGPGAKQALLRLTNGAKMEGSPTFQDMTFEGELHNYNPNIRRPQWPAVFNGYSFTVVIRSNFTLNGTIHFHRHPTDDVYGQLSWGPGAARLEGVGRIIFERGQYGAGIFQPDRLVVGPDITLDLPEVTLNGTSLENRGTINVLAPGANNNISAFTNSGTIRIASSATLTNGYLTQTASGRLMIEASGTERGVTHGFVRARSAADLAGTLTLQPVAGFQPQLGSAFEVLTFFTRTGNFSSYVTPQPPVSSVWQTQFGSTNLVLRLLAASPAAAYSTSKSFFEIQRHIQVEQTFTKVAHAEGLNLFPVTFMAWVKIEGGGDQRQNLISKLQQDPKSGYSIHLDAGRLRAHYFRNELIAIGADAAGLDGGFIADGNWHHIAFSVDESGAVLFVDCAVKAEAGWNSVQRGYNGLGGGCNGSAPLVIGGSQVSPSAIEEISLWSKSMDAEEMFLKRTISENSEPVDLIWYQRALLPVE